MPNKKPAVMSGPIDKAISEMTDEEKEYRQLEHIKVYGCDGKPGNFLYFLDEYVKIIEPKTLMQAGGLVKFQTWPHLMRLTRDLLDDQILSVVILKSRQIGVSWLLAAWTLWNAMTKMGDMTMLFSKGQDESVALLDKCRKIYLNLPPFLKHEKVDPDSTEAMGFPIMQSLIKAFVSTPSAGVGFNAARLICDEWEQHPYASENYTNAKPTIDAGAKFVGCFTIDKTKTDSLARTIFKGARGGRNNFKAHFFGYKCRPGRDDAWYEKVRLSVPEEELEGLSRDLYMQGNYPATEQEALEPAKTLRAFDPTVVEAMRERCCAPVKIQADGVDTGICHIYQGPMIGDFYVAGTDTSHGTGKDYSVTAIMNVKTGVIVADILDNRLRPEELAYHSVKLLEFYRNPMWWIEDNDWGGVTISKALSLGYRNMGYRDKDGMKCGWHTDNKSREELWGKLIPAFNNCQVTVFSYQGLMQFRDCIRDYEKGRIEAAQGKNDDYPMAVGICVVKCEEINVLANWRPKPIQTFHFGPRADNYDPALHMRR